VKINGLKVIREGSGLETIEEAWSEKPTFVFLPRKSRVSDDWLNDQLSQVPESHANDRFGLLTSGSTGEPKIILSLKSRAEKLSLVLHDLQDSANVQSTIISLPLSYSFAFVNQWTWAKVTGRKLVFSEGLKEPEDFLSKLILHEDSMLCLVGAQVPMIINNYGGMIFENVIRIHFAGGPFPQTHFDDIKSMFPNARVFNNFGCAEAMPRLTLREAHPGDAPNDVGMPITGVKLRISEKEEVEFISDYRADGQISSGIFKEIDDSSWLPTGDLGRINSEGSLILSGRTNSVFKRYGEKISLMQILHLVNEIWDYDVAIYREEDSSREPGYVLVLSPMPDRSAIRGILGEFRKRFPRTHWPLRIESCKNMPKLPNGKDDILALRSISEKKIEWSQRI